MASINISTTKEVIPQCYAYTTPGISYHDGWTKIGFTERDVETRVKEQTQTANIKYIIHWHKNAIFEGSNESFSDNQFHGYLKRLGINREPGTEWFQIEPGDAKSNFNDFRENRGVLESNHDPIPYKLRQEQEEAVKMTMEYFKTHENGEFLWNAKPRFGKTLSTYDLSMRMGFKNILIVTNRPAIANSWYSDYEQFVGVGTGYYFVSRVDALKGKPYVLSRDEYMAQIVEDDNPKGCIEFVSLQDIKGSKYFGGDSTADKLKEISDHVGDDGKPVGIVWDILVIDEAHEGVDTYKTDIAFDHIKRKNTLHLSGTPFKALANDKFQSDAIYNWTYADEQQAKAGWDTTREEENPYLTLPKLNLFTYQMSEIIRERIEDGINLDGETEEYAFDLNEFFSTKESGKFTYEADVDKFLDALTTLEKFPFSTEELRNELKHTFWILNRVDSAKALARKLKVHPVFRDYEIILAAGDGRLDENDSNEKAFNQVVNAINKYEKTITLSVGQLTTGITIPEWTGVLMLSNMKSPALYMQAAFRVQNPCLFGAKGKTYRKENAYVFDFDPARTLTIFEEFANDLSIATSGGRGDAETRKSNVRELLNFFPVYGEDSEGKMIELDAEKILTIPRKIHALEVVNRGFMSNFLFANISNIFSAPGEVRDIINKFQPVEEGKTHGDVNIDDNTRENLNLDENNEVAIPEEQIIGKAKEIFGKKIYGDISKDVDTAAETLKSKEKVGDVKTLQNEFTKPFTETLIDVAKDAFGDDISKSTQRELEFKIKRETTPIITQEYGNWRIESGIIESRKQEEINNAKSGSEVTDIENKYEEEADNRKNELYKRIQEKLKDIDFVTKSQEFIVETVETEKKNKEKKAIEDDVRDHLRGFSRTIPSFLMAYGTDESTLSSFHEIVPANVFEEVTGITLEQFMFLRDGGYYEDDDGETKYFAGKLFDEIVFDDAVKEFLTKKHQLANYFAEDTDRDIFDYIPLQKTNQIFTPMKVVREMVDFLEKENPGCFDDPSKTFIDLYMKSGLYIAEIVKRLYRSDGLKESFPDEKKRLEHIFEYQVFGLAPTEIIYQIALNFVLGFSEDGETINHNLRKLDSMACIQEGNLEEKLDEVFGSDSM